MQERAVVDEANAHDGTGRKLNPNTQKKKFIASQTSRRLSINFNGISLRIPTGFYRLPGSFLLA
jgi:ribosomal protein L28